MYAFAVVVLLGIGAFKLVDMVSEYLNLSKITTLFTILIGVLIAWALDFSLYAEWDIAVRSNVLGYVGTGLMIAAAGYAVPQVFAHVGDVIGRRRQGETSRVKAA